MNHVAEMVESAREARECMSKGVDDLTHANMLRREDVIRASYERRLDLMVATLQALVQSNQTILEQLEALRVENAALKSTTA